MSNLQNKHHGPDAGARHLRRLVQIFVLMSVLTASFAFAGDDPPTRRREL